MYNNWVELLGRYNIAVPMNRSEFNILCPLHEEKNPSCSINIEKGVWICHVGCGQGSLASLIQQLDEDVQIKIESPEWSEKFNFLGDEEEEIELDQPVHFPFSMDSANSWIVRERGFNKILLDCWGCKVTPQGSLAIPIMNSKSRTVGWICRRAKGLEPRYFCSRGMKKRRVVFGLNRASDRWAVIVEGALNALWLDQHRFPSIALLGASMSDVQEKLIAQAHFDEVALCLDNDEAGERASENIAKRLQKYCSVTHIPLPSEYNDIQDVRNVDVIERVINDRSEIKHVWNS